MLVMLIKMACLLASVWVMDVSAVRNRELHYFKELAN